MNYKIVMDSSSNLTELEGAAFVSAPLKVLSGEREFVDDGSTDIEEMVDYLSTYNGRTVTACPGVGDFEEAYQGADNVFCFTITSALSGSYNAASVAAINFAEANPGKRIHVFDTLTTGPEMALLGEKLVSLVKENLPFDEIVEKVKEYMTKTRLAFSLESLHNLAQNGRVPAPVAKIAGILGMRLIGIASDEGTLKPTGKARGEKKVPLEMLKQMLDMGYNGGKVLIHHCCNLPAAEKLKEVLCEKFPAANIRIALTGALCSFYAEKGGLLVGFETI